ncbi:hypothetical protein B0T16DRAFT_10567 [Cercophora newfieldiana]|uniref:Uncharacterized protein n=1 Tax=Cercophora newfieldiana TaxID=92897 RepID=A0AA39YMS4_9PEZI|nr:hypothetical protein B0T16DRAFT_10567 [Cercophora newfieldiana]
MPAQYSVRGPTQATQALTHASQPLAGRKKAPSKPQRRKRTTPGSPRGNAPRLAPSIRRRLSQFELEVSPEPSGDGDSQARPRQQKGRRGSTAKATKRASTGRRTKKLKKRASAGASTENLVGNGGLVPEPPAKETRRGRKVVLPARLRD